MPIEGGTAQVLIASIEGTTLNLVCTLFMQGVGLICGFMCAATVAITWKG